MSDALWVEPVLTSVGTRMSSRFPTMIDEISADGGIEVTDPVTVEVRSDIDSITALPHVALMAAEVDIERLLPHSYYLRIPLECVITAQPDPSFSTPDRHMMTYERAAILTLTESGMQGSVSGLFNVVIDGTGPVETPDGKDRHRRRTTVRATLHVKTTRIMQ